jgi:cytochrome c oxidase assembly protein subunit 15
MRKLIWLAVLLASILLPLGAYVRLSQSGLGCPDWPGCFGQLSPAQAAPAIAQAMQRDADGPVSLHKAWTEMAHRYLAGGLGLLLLAYWWQAWRHRQQLATANVLLAVLLLQAMLGMLTVTLQLRPLIVSSHLLLGMCLFALLLSTASRRYWPSQAVAPPHWRLAALLLLVLAGQIGLGGWMAANQAALACQGFPRCNGDWWPAMPLSAALPGWHGGRPDHAPLPLAALVAVHWLHRVGAAVLSGVLLLVIWRLWSYPSLRRQLCLLGLLAGLQLLLGMANVLLQRPLPIALAHHVLAMLLLATAGVLLCRLHARSARHVSALVQRAAHRPSSWARKGIGPHPH